MSIMEHSSSNKVPYWFEDLTNSHGLFARSLSKPRPQSWKPSGQNDITNIIVQERRAITTPGRVDVTPVKKALLGLQLDDIGDVTPRGGSALYGRRAVNSTTEDTDNISASLPLAPTPTDDLWDGEILPIVSPQERRPSSRVSKSKLQIHVQKKLTPMDKSLEESWSSLSFFNRKHRGRLSRKIEDIDDDVVCAGYNITINPTPSKQSTSPPIVQEFVIPELPSGRRLEIDITATWGDRHYLGMNGFEIFSASGELVQVAEITAEPADINILPEYQKDPRVIANLMDGVNRTRDDMHLWLAPFTEGAHHFIRIKFVQKETIAMMRIWNYNKSRIHSYRGVKDIHITLDGELIFRGEIARACGGILGGTDAFGDTILFTTDEDILERVSQHDDSFESVMNEGSSEPVFGRQVERPLTASIGDIRPLTCAGSMLGSTTFSTTGSVLCTESITLQLLENWGHCQLIGLTGLQVLGETGSPVSIAEISYSGRTNQEMLNRLLDGTNETTDSKHMWIAELDKRNNLILRLCFATPVHITAVTIWNYNSSLEKSYCGVKQVVLKLDHHPTPLDNGVLTLRRAPGHCHYSFGQIIPLVPNRSESSLSVRINSVLAAITPRSVYEEEYESPEMPRGFVFQLLLLSTWGDLYYVGLNGIQLYDSQGSLIHLTENNISAYPHSVNVLEGVDNDVRTPDKLIDGVNDTTDGCHMWLAPILPGEINRVYIVFDSPVAVSMLKLWNYGKTPARGVKEFGILVDDLLVYNGVLDSTNKQGSRNVPYRTVILASNSELAKRERSTQILHHGVELFDEHRARSHCSVDQSQRPLTSLRPPSVSSSLLDL